MRNASWNTFIAPLSPWSFLDFTKNDEVLTFASKIEFLSKVCQLYVVAILFVIPEGDADDKSGPLALIREQFPLCKISE